MFLQEERKQNTLFLVRELNLQIFETSLVSYLLFYLLDDLFNKIVSNYFNLNILLIVVIISGVILNLRIFPQDNREKKSKPIKVKDYLFIIGLGLAAAGIIYYKIQLDFWLRLTISIISGLIIILLSTLLLNEDNEKYK